MAETNMAPLSKMVWMMTTSSQHPWVKFLQAKYLKRTEFLQAERKASASWVWKDLLKSRPLINKGRCFLISTGDKVRTWIDPWIPGLPSFRPSSHPNNLLVDRRSRVSHFINSSVRTWNRSLLDQTFDCSSVEKILQIHLPPSSSSNRAIWKPDPKGSFSIKSAHKLVITDRLSGLDLVPQV